MRAKDILKETWEEEGNNFGRLSLFISSSTDSIKATFNINDAEIESNFSDAKYDLINEYHALRKIIKEKDPNSLEEFEDSFADKKLMIYGKDELSQKYEARLGELAVGFRNLVRSILLEMDEERLQNVKKLREDLQQLKKKYE